VIFLKEPLRRFLKWTQRALLACAVLLLGYCGLVLVDSWLFQWRASRDLDLLLRDRMAASRISAQPDEQAVAARVSPVALPGALIGRMKIPRLRLSEVVMEGVDTITLRRAVGHIPGTAIPGQSGNVGLAGHRDTFFRSLKDVKIDDEIQVSTERGSFTYQVVSLRVVEPEDVGVLAPAGENVLTLVTCYPFYFVGPAPRRWIVRARQVAPQIAASSTMK
jgi:sortase A